MVRHFRVGTAVFVLADQGAMAHRSAQTRREIYCRCMKEIYHIAIMSTSNPEHESEFFARYPDVEKIAEQFELAYLKVIQEIKSDSEFNEEDLIRAQFDELYYAVKAKYRTLSAAAQSGEANADTPHSCSKVKLPRISLPRFSGDVALWPSFFALYNTSIHDNMHLSDIEK